MSTKKDEQTLEAITQVEAEAQLPSTPRVSVCIVTYNQAGLIQDALDSALEQKTDFPYEIVVGDDCSEDGTREILRRYQQAHPESIRLNLHEEHYEGITARKNMVTNLQAARGKYVALLDGDDYWMSPDKLRVQTAYLEANPDTALSFHDAETQYATPAARRRHAERTPHLPEEGSRYSDRFPDALARDRDFSHQEMIAWGCDAGAFSVPASSVMFRQALFTPVPDWFWEVYYADKIMQIYLSRDRDVRYHSDLLGARRFTANSVSTRPRTLAENRHIIREGEVVQNVCPAYSAHGSLSAAYLWEMRYWRRRSAYGKAIRCLMKALPNYTRLRAEQSLRWLASTF